MKKFIALILCICSLSMVGCGETCKHNYSVVESESYLATCEFGGVTVEECTVCHKKRTCDVEAKGHEYLKDTSYQNYISSTSDSASYYKSCKTCAQKSTETFNESIDILGNYAPMTPTLVLCDTQNSLSYGITYNCYSEPLTPVIQIKTSAGEEWKTYDVDYEKDLAYLDSQTRADIYYCKAVISVLPNVNYQYKIVEYASKTESELFSFTSADINSDEFSFASFSDSQNLAEDGSLWREVLQNTSDVDFYLHSGDICDETSLENNWTTMLNLNRDYFATKPLMAVAGNHDTTYKADPNSLYKHFNVNLPTQDSPKYGYFYSFNYGNAKFIMINTNKLTGDKLMPEQYNWLINQLIKNDATWTIVTMHCPMYSIGKWGNNLGQISRQIRGQLNDIFAHYGVDIVIQGHDHAVSKTYPIGKSSQVINATKQTIGNIEYDVNPEGTIYLMNGPTGDQSRGAVDSIETQFYEVAKTGYAQSWAEYAISKNKLTVTVKYLDESAVKEYYSWGIIKSN